MLDQKTSLLNSALFQGVPNFNLPPPSTVLPFPGAVIQDQTENTFVTVFCH